MKGRDRKHRVTFRVAPDLAAALQQLPNQTAFVEAALRDALRQSCPLCDGSGRAPVADFAVPDFRDQQLPRLAPAAGRRLREIVRLGRRVWATGLELTREADAAWRFRLRRGDELLLTGRIGDGSDDHDLVLGEPSRSN